jgi:hypothetical protein
MPSPAVDPAAFVFEQLGLICLHANMAQTYLEAGDNPGFSYSLKSLTARTRAVVGLVNDLEARKPEDPTRG